MTWWEKYRHLDAFARKPGEPFMPEPVFEPGIRCYNHPGGCPRGAHEYEDELAKSKAALARLVAAQTRVQTVLNTNDTPAADEDAAWSELEAAMAEARSVLP